jgi:hypothetical protein
MVTGRPLEVGDDLGDYARRLAELRSVQLQVGEMLTAWEEGAGREASRLAHELARDAAQIRAELARWVAVNTPMPPASGSLVGLVDRGVGGR